MSSHMCSVLLTAKVENTMHMAFLLKAAGGMFVAILICPNVNVLSGPVYNACLIQESVCPSQPPIDLASRLV